MELTELLIPGVFLFTPRVFEDPRGWFYESYSERTLQECELPCSFVQDNRSYSLKKNTLRGLHCQAAPAAQTKLISCTRGVIRDVVVDVRADSPSFGKWITVELSEDNKQQLLIPRGCLHGFVTRTNRAEVFYKVDAPYSPLHDRAVRWNDPLFGIDWGVAEPILSQKDREAPLWRDAKIQF